MFIQMSSSHGIPQITQDLHGLFAGKLAGAKRRLEERQHRETRTGFLVGIPRGYLGTRPRILKSHEPFRE